MLVLVLFLPNLNLIFLFILIISARVSTYMVRYQDKDPPHLVPLDLTVRGVRMPTDREIRLSNRRVHSVGVREARKGKELEKEPGKVEVKYNMVSKGDWQKPIALHNLLDEGVAEADQER